MVLLASRAYRAHKRNLHLRATPALSLHPEKARNKRNEFYAVERRDKVQASPRRRVSFERLWPPGYIAKICNSIIIPLLVETRCYYAFSRFLSKISFVKGRRIN